MCTYVNTYTRMQALHTADIHDRCPSSCTLQWANECAVRKYSYIASNMGSIRSVLLIASFRTRWEAAVSGAYTNNQREGPISTGISALGRAWIFADTNSGMWHMRRDGKTKEPCSYTWACRSHRRHPTLHCCVKTTEPSSNLCKQRETATDSLQTKNKKASKIMPTTACRGRVCHCLSHWRVLMYVLLLHLYGCTAVTVSFLDVPQRCVFHHAYGHLLQWNDGVYVCLHVRMCTHTHTHTSIYTNTQTDR